VSAQTAILTQGVPHGTTNPQAGFSVISCMIGSGILALPHAMVHNCCHATNILSALFMTVIGITWLVKYYNDGYRMLCMFDNWQVID
jgi:hypothetical protein